MVTSIRNEFLKGGVDTLHSESLKETMGEAGRSCLSAAEGLLGRLPTGIMPLESVVLPIHLDITFNHEFAHGLDRMVGVGLEIPLGRAIAGNWIALAPGIGEFPPDAELRFNGESGVVYLVIDGASRPLLKVSAITSEERGHLAEVLDSATILERVQGTSESVAEKLLSIPVTPRPSWQRWGNAFGQLREELIFVLSNFPGSVSLLKDHVPLLTRAGREALELLDQRAALDAPELNHDWQNEPRLASMLGKRALRARGRQ